MASIDKIRPRKYSISSPDLSLLIAADKVKWPAGLRLAPCGNAIKRLVMPRKKRQVKARKQRLVRDRVGGAVFSAPVNSKGQAELQNLTFRGTLNNGELLR